LAGNAFAPGFAALAASSRAAELEMMRVKLADSSAAPVIRAAIGSGHARAVSGVKSRGAAGIGVSFLERLCIS
jgi:hypothetical protein